jgi:hypothetical protein
MRVLFLVLVLANLALFAWSRYFTAAPAAAEGVLARREDSGELKIVPPAEATGDAAAGCLEWGGFTPAEYARAEKALEPLALGPRLGQRRSDDTAGWWVFIPPQGSRQAALKKAAELKALGVHDYYIMGEEGDSPWALSLGVFRTEQAALARLAMLRDQGVKSALVGSRDQVLPRMWLQVRGVDAVVEARLREAARQFEGSELRVCR